MTATFNLNKLELIRLALQSVNIIDLPATPDSETYQVSSKLLNLMLKKWEAQGINLWKRRQGYLFTALNDEQYELGTSGFHATLSYTATALSNSASSLATVLSVSSNSGMTAGDFIGIELDDGTRHWDTIASVAGDTSVTITSGLASAAASGNNVVFYTNKISRPLRVLRATTLDLRTTNHNEVAMRISSYDEYFNTPVKSSSGRPNNFYYDRLLNGSTPYTGTLFLYPRPNNVNYIIAFTFQESIADLSNVTDYADFPQEWLDAVRWNLAVEMAYFFGKFQELQVIEPKAQRELEIAQLFDSDDAPLRFSVNNKGF